MDSHEEWIRNWGQTRCRWLEADEDAGLISLAELVDSTEEIAAQTAHAGFVSVLDVLEGHEMCTEASWVYPVRPFAVFHHYSGHPTEQGQWEIESKVAADWKLA